MRWLLRPALLAAALLAGSTAAAGSVIAGVMVPATQSITPKHAGDVKLGARFTALYAKHEVGKVEHGCELAGSQARAATLLSPLRGSVTLTDTAPRKVATITVTGGGAARGIGVGSSATALRKAFPKAVFDHSTESVFAITLVKVPKGAGGRLQFAVSTKTKHVTEIGIPNIPFCD